MSRATWWFINYPNRGCSGSRYSWILFATLNVPICLIIDVVMGIQDWFQALRLAWWDCERSIGHHDEKWYLFASCGEIPFKYTNSDRRWRDYYVLVYFITHLAVNIAPPVGWLGRWLSYLSFRLFMFRSFENVVFGDNAWIFHVGTWNMIFYV